MQFLAQSKINLINFLKVLLEFIILKHLFMNESFLELNLKLI